MYLFTVPDGNPVISLSVQQTRPGNNTGKSQWKGRNNGEVMTVEEFSLQHYEVEGWKGCVHFQP